jgi:hypothetical protein
MLIVLSACAGSDAGNGPEPIPSEDAGTGITSDTSWVPGSDSVASRVMTVDGGNITLPRAFTVEIEPATLTDTQTVVVSLTHNAVGNPPWTGRVAFARTCPPRPVHLTAVIPSALSADTLAAITPVLPGSPNVIAYTQADGGRVLRFTISEQAFKSAGSGERSCGATFAFSTSH